MSCTGISCNQGHAPRTDGCHKPQRTCTELGVCQHRQPPCSDDCANPPIVPRGLPVRLLGTAPVDTARLPPGGFWFAPGTIDEHPAPEPLTWLEVALIALCGSGALAFLAGVVTAWWKGIL